MMAIHEHIFGDDRPFPQCHASTLVRMASGKILAAWFGGTHEKHNDVAIWMAERTDGRWSPVRQAARVEDLPHWNPVLFADAKNRVHLFFKMGPTPQTWETWTMTSADEGTTWTEPKRMDPAGDLPRGPVKNKPIILSDGAWLAGSSTEIKEQWDVFVDRSEDEGRSWQVSDLIPLDHAGFPGKGVIQPTLWESAPGRVHMLMRSSCGWICRSDSDDGGRAWRPIYKTDLPNNNSGIDVAKLSDGSLALVYNPVGKDWGARTPLSVSLSFDNGKTWPRRIDLETEPGEYSYPAVIPAPEGMAITYTWKRQRIAFWMGSLDEIPKQ
ncbi:MAG: sialidase family protein [Planctomycetota bacterium]